ncbi:DUF2066 domain-containing protein [Stutzerimonas azotifigens]|uniref:DUF2066 domain-containing protein n=1 Tax=Stutzerimonas azotifigens TaxID=291995 RepID=UPI00040EB6BA|nr:DUF2066 domain-containing protein [Stutzerimonas azotifigens]
MRPLVRLFALCCALLVLPAQAATLADLYLVREPVASQQASERDEALQRAFDTLVRRLTGDASVSESSAVAALRQDPQQLVRQYGYKGDSLVVEFDPATVQRGLRDAGVKLWGESRPALLGWWLFDSAEGTQLVGDGQEGASVLRNAAQHRGVVLRLPLADLDEQLAATPDALDAGDAGALHDLSERYDADGLMSVHARESEGRWQADWRLWLGEERGQGQASGDSREQVADAVMQAVTDHLAPRYVADPGQAAEVTLWVEGADLARYAELDRLLQPLGAQLVRLEGGNLVYHLRVAPEQLRSQLALARLQEVPASETPPVPVQVPAMPVPPLSEPSVDAAQPPAERPLVDPAGGRQVLHYRW